jgi:hypothetical protein
VGEGVLPLHWPQADWQPVLQWLVVVPHQPYWEQHWPLGHLVLMEAPQAPPGAAILTVVVGVGVVLVLPHWPQLAWHPVPQWSVVTPHQPYCEQHWPLGHLALAEGPQAPPGAAVVWASLRPEPAVHVHGGTAVRRLMT